MGNNCPQCGAELESADTWTDNQQFCTACGWPEHEAAAGERGE